MTESTRAPRVSRESRLLLATVAVCALALVVLARIRFPEQTPAAEVTAPPPLERLAARASYDALASDIQRVEPIIGGRLVALRVAEPRLSTPRTLDDALAGSRGPSPLRHVAALRITDDTAIAVVPPDARIEGVLSAAADAGASVLAMDPLRHLARIQVPAAPLRELRQATLASLVTPAYVVAVEATQAGVTLRPVFLGRGDRFTSSRWSRPLLPLGGIAVAPGALMFTLDGEFIGIVVTENGNPVVVGARDVLDTAERLLPGGAAPVDLGLSLQRLTPALREALAAEHGVVVAEVRTDSPAAGLLAPADVIVNVDGWATDDPDELLLHLGAQPTGTLSVIRNRQAQSVPLGTAPGNSGHEQANGRFPASIFAIERGVGTRVVPSRDAEPPQGLAPGDLIVRAGAFAAPTPAQVQQALGQGQRLATFVVRRDGVQRVVAVTAATAAAQAR